MVFHSSSERLQPVDHQTVFYPSRNRLQIVWPTNRLSLKRQTSVCWPSNRVSLVNRKTSVFWPSNRVSLVKDFSLLTIKSCFTSQLTDFRLLTIRSCFTRQATDFCTDFFDDLPLSKVIPLQWPPKLRKGYNKHSNLYISSGSLHTPRRKRVPVL